MGQSDVQMREEEDKRLLWQKNVDIVTAFLATNGQIEITLVAAYTTALAFLITWGNSLTGFEKEVTFTAIIPLLSLVVLVLALNVYSWISIQITYLRVEALSVENLSSPFSYFDFRDQAEARWNSIPSSKKTKILLTEGIKYYVRLPVNIRDVYCYYFTIYIVSPIASIIYVAEGCKAVTLTIIIIFMQLGVVSFGLRDKLIVTMFTESS